MQRLSNYYEVPIEAVAIQLFGAPVRIQTSCVYKQS
jgi:hypothetical protein